MLIEELHSYYGTWADTMRALKLAPNTYLGWRKKGCVPWLTQLDIERKTNRRFIASKDHTNIKKKPWEIDSE